MDGEPYTTSDLAMQGKVVQRGGASQVKVVTGGDVEVKSKVLPDLHDSDYRQQTQTAKQTSPDTHRDTPTTESQTNTPIKTTDTKTHTTQHQSEPPTTKDQDTDSQASTDTVTQTTDKQAELHDLQGASLGTSESPTEESTVMKAAGVKMDTDRQTHSASVEPQEAQTETSVKELIADDRATMEAQEEATESQTQMSLTQEQEKTFLEPQTEMKASAAHSKTQTVTEVAVPQTVPETQTEGDAAITQMMVPQIAPNTDIETNEWDTETSMKGEQMDDPNTMVEMEDKDWSLSDMESAASTCSSENCPRKHPATSSQPGRRRTLSRRSKNSIEQTSNPDLQGEGETPTEHQEEIRVTRKSLRVKTKVTPLRNSAKSTTGKGQKRRSEGKELPPKRQSRKKRRSLRP